MGEEELIRVQIGDAVQEYPRGITFEQIARQWQDRYEATIVLAVVNGKLRELHHTLEQDAGIRFITMADTTGIQTYHRSAVLLMTKAFYDVAGKVDKLIVDFSVSKGYYVEAYGEFAMNEELLQKVDARMRDLVEQDLPIEKRTVSTAEAIDFFHRYGMYDKEKLFFYRRVSHANLYRIGQFEDYNYGYMVPSTGYLKLFALYRYRDGFVLQLPQKDDPGRVPAFAPSTKVFETLLESSRWGGKLQAETVGDINDRIVNGSFSELILIQEALMEKKLSQIAEAIATDRRKKIILIAGPSSSGKTSFSHRLSIQLKTFGLTPHPIAVDNYFKNRSLAPRHPDGSYNFESLECVDVELFNEHMLRLLQGERVELPSYNFQKGEREYRGNTLQLKPDDILVIEGIHCLNDQMSYRLPADSRYRIYVSALTQLNIDEHNRIPTTDGRLIRRIVRDARTRGFTAQDTIASWNSVRLGEEENIFPYQDSADVVFNSALIYEFSILKTYAEPLLFSVPRDSEEYLEAKRLLKFFDYFLPASSEDIPRNSLLREFIGGSVFPVG